MKFEYYSQYMQPAEGIDYKAKLDAMGALGWELVEIVGEDNLHVFKREIPEGIKLKIDKQLLTEQLEQSYKHDE